MSEYDTDILLWSGHQAALLRRRAAGEVVNEADLDWPNIAEEIEDVANRHRDRVYGALQTTLVHLLKWQFQPAARSNSWRSAVTTARVRIAKACRDMPSMANYPAAVLADAYAGARRIAEAETGLAGLPEACPWPIEQVLAHEFWPT